MNFFSQSSSQKIVWIDGRNVARGNGTGVATYARNLAQGLSDIGATPSFLIDALENNHKDNAWKVNIKRYMYASLPFKKFQVKIDKEDPYIDDIFRIAHIRHKIFSREIELYTKNPPHIMHWTYPLPLYLYNTINITTIHDLIPLTNPELTGICPKNHFQILEKSIKNSQYILTVSETVRAQIIKMLDIPAHRVVNIYQKATVSSQEKETLIHTPSCVPAGSFVYIGRVEKRKNIERLIQAHAMSQTTRPLCIIGPDGDDQPSFMPYHSNQKIIRVSWTDRPSLLRALYEAHALLLPSLAEGFGLPIIEAMSLGTPVITSKGGATEEIAGGAAYLVDPYNVQDMAAGISLLDTTTSQHSRFVELGYKRSNFFSEKQQNQRLEMFYRNFIE